MVTEISQNCTASLSTVKLFQLKKVTDKTKCVNWCLPIYLRLRIISVIACSKNSFVNSA
jgi:hypothetical protein